MEGIGFHWFAEPYIPHLGCGNALSKRQRNRVQTVPPPVLSVVGNAQRTEQGFAAALSRDDRSTPVREGRPGTVMAQLEGYQTWVLGTACCGVPA